jgi:membrane-bound metal-dependent hydrolase YbcI (DUF457 family)
VLGHTHALSGTVTGTAAGLLLHAGTSGTADLALLGAGFAVVPDLDKCGATVSRSCGFLTEAFAWAVGRISGGHRHGTHSILGVAVFTGFAWLACVFRRDLPGRIGLAVLLAIGLASGLRALRLGGHFADALAIAGAAAVCWTGWDLALIPLASAAGTGTHVAGDMLTVEGCPLAWPLSDRHVRILPRPLAFTTGTWREHLVVTPLLVIALAWLGYRAVAGTDVTTLHAHLTGRTRP